MDILRIINSEFYNTFLLETDIKKVKQRPNKSQSWKIKFESKAIWMLFNKLFEIPAGKKSNIVKVPEIVKELDEETIKQFVYGFFLADGGNKKKNILFSTTSKDLAYDLRELFNRLKLIHSFNTINDHKLRRVFFEILIRERNAPRFKSLLPETSIKFNHAGVA